MTTPPLDPEMMTNGTGPTPLVTTLPPQYTYRTFSGRRAKVRTWTDAEARRAAEQRVTTLGERDYVWLQYLYEFLALTEGRLFALTNRAGNKLAYKSFTTKLNRSQAEGLIQLISPTATFSDLRQAKLSPYFTEHDRELRVWTLGPVGEALVKHLWEPAFVPVGTVAHMVHHVLAAEYLFRYQAVAAAKQKSYTVHGPRQCGVWKMGDDQQLHLLRSPDGLLIRRNASTQIDAAFLVEYHNEDKPGRAKEKILGYDRLLNDEPEAIRAAWNLPVRPKIMVVWRHHAIQADYQRAMQELASLREAKYGKNIAEFRHIYLGNALTHNPLLFFSIEDGILTPFGSVRSSESELGGDVPT